MRYPIMSLDDNSRFESALPASVESGRDDVVAKSGTITATPLVRAIGNKPCRAAMCASHDRPVRPQSTPSDPPQSPEKPTRAQAADLRIEALGSRVACYIVRPSRHSASLIAGQGLSCAATSIQYRTADVTRIRAVVGGRALQDISPRYTLRPTKSLRGTRGDFSETSSGLIFATGAPKYRGSPSVSRKHVNPRLCQVDQRQGNEDQQYPQRLPAGHLPVYIWRMAQ